MVHSFESLAGALPRQPPSAKPLVWSTFYDIRRYGGLQIYLRAVLSGCAAWCSPVRGSRRASSLARAGALGVTHISGTPSHWRRALMSGETALIAPEYVRLSGEVADQTVLDNLRAAYPQARVAHAFASTEAGVAFDVNDGLAGFPENLIGNSSSGIDLKVQDGTLVDPLAAQRRALSWAMRLRRSSAPMATSTPAIWWNLPTGASIFAAAGAASSMSAA